jgi:hypothetical protein
MNLASRALSGGPLRDTTALISGGDYLPHRRGFEITSEQRWPVAESHQDVARLIALEAQRAAQMGQNVSDAGDAMLSMTAPHLAHLPGMSVPEQASQQYPMQIAAPPRVLQMFERGLDPSFFRGFSNRPNPWDRVVRPQNEDGLDLG